MLVVLVGLVLLVAVARVPILTPDVWWHLATGQWVAQFGIPQADPFSYTLEGRSWTAHEWLADWLLHHIHRQAGLVGVVWWRAFLITASLVLAYAVARLRAPALLALALVGVAGYATQRNWLDRPQLWSFLWTPLVLLLLERHRLGSRRSMFVLPCLFLLWVNLHGGFMLGLGMLGLWFAASAAEILRRGERVWSPVLQLGGVLGVCGIVVLANPNGLDGALYPLRYLGSGLRNSIQEERVGLLDTPYAWVHLGLVVLLLLVFLLRRRQVPLQHWILGMALAWISMPRLGPVALPFAAERHAPLFLLAATPLLAWHGAALAGAGWRRIETAIEAALRTPQAWTVALALLGYGLWQTTRHLPRDARPVARLLPGRFPEAGATWLDEARLPGPLLNPYRWGGYLIYRLWPHYKVWIDSRGDLYGAERLREDELLYRMPHGTEVAAQNLLQRYDANVIIYYFLTLDFGPLQVHPFAHWLLRHPGWRLVFYDRPDPSRPRAPSATTAIFLRDHPRNAEALARHPPVALPRGLPLSTRER